LRAEIGRPDGVRLGHGGGATILISPDGKRETERKDQSDHPEQRRLKDSERLAERGGVLSQISAGREPRERRCPDHDEDDQSKLPAAQPEEHGKILKAAPVDPRTRGRCTAADPSIEDPRLGNRRRQR
jgi:hypothetical protein